jgi:hypothetical protein
MSITAVVVVGIVTHGATIIGTDQSIPVVLPDGVDWTHFNPVLSSITFNANINTAVFDLSGGTGISLTVNVAAGGSFFGANGIATCVFTDEIAPPYQNVSVQAA